MKIIKGDITTPEGFLANGLSAGIKRSGKPDLALIFCQVPAITAGVFTKNSIKAAPLVLTIERLKKNVSQAVVINSGNANCYTGKAGDEVAQRSTERIAELLKIDERHVFVASTGIIGRPLPYEKIHNAAPELIRGLGKHKGHEAAKAILTTDLATKEIAVQVKIDGKMITIAGIAKGSGMIAPNMATMLGFITTDVAITKPMLKLALKRANDQSFNAITVDGCMSTNDMATVMASGLAGNKAIKTSGKNFETFCNALTFVCVDLAKKIVLDAEGGTKFITVTVKGAKTETQAKEICFAIANSPLVKTAAYGSNPNWGRVAAAVGSLGLKISEKTMEIGFSPFDKKEIEIRVGLKLGNKAATVYTSDLSVEYVNINGKYN